MHINDAVNSYYPVLFVLGRYKWSREEEGSQVSKVRGVCEKARR